MHYFFLCNAHSVARAKLERVLERELSMDITDRDQLLSTFLYGTPTIADNKILLKGLFDYLIGTKRFK